MGTAVKHPLPDRVKPYVVCNFWHPGTLTLSAENSKLQIQNCNDVRFNPVWHRMHYSCTHVATVGVKGLIFRGIAVGFQNSRPTYSSWNSLAEWYCAIHRKVFQRPSNRLSSVTESAMMLFASFAFFSARQHMQSALYAIVRPSVCLSHKSIGQKRLKFDYAIFTVQ